jgi:hypothetical protein
MHPATFPPARRRAPGVSARSAEKYERQHSSGQVTAADTDAELVRFSGQPDTILLTCHENGAVFTLQDRLGRDPTEVLVPADNSIETHFAAEVVLVRNHAAGSNAHVCAIGKWAEEGPRGRGD